MIHKYGVIGHSIPYGVGDKYMDGWFWRLANLLSRPVLESGKLTRQPEEGIECEFKNLAINGGTTADVLKKYKIEMQKFDTLFIESGTNELPRNPDGQPILSAEERAAAWGELLRLARENTGRIIVLDLLPFYRPRLGLPGDMTISMRDMRDYNARLNEICSGAGAEFFQRFDEWDNADLPKYLADAFHPNAMGHQRIAKEIFYYLRPQGIGSK
jgi:lysophospholipase L1-like esterase